MQKKRNSKNKKSRIEQIEQQLQEEEMIRQQNVIQQDNEFIEEDIVQEDTQNTQQRIKPAKRISQKQNVQNGRVNNKEQQLKDQQTKALMENIMKKKLDTGPKKLNPKAQQEIAQRLSQMQIRYKQNSQNNGMLLKTVKNKVKYFYDEYQQKQDKLIEQLQHKNQPLNFFLSEIVPDKKKQDILYLFGKVHFENDNMINTCVTVGNLVREIYVMPKKNHTADEVLIEIKQKISDHSQGKKIQINYEIVKKKYCFEFDVDYRDEEIEVVKLSYSFADKELKWLKQIGQYYKGIFGLTYKSEELFLLQNRIRGTEWIQISNYEINQEQQVTDNMFNITIKQPWQSFKNISQNLKIPKFSIGALQVEFNTDTQKIVGLCYSLYQNFDIQNSLFEVVDNFILTTLNTDIENELQNSKNERNFVKKFDNEYQMLVDFSLLFSKSNPDLLVGHEIIASTFEVIIKRMQSLLIDTNDLGRLKKSKHNKNIGNLKYNLREVFSGRLLFDIYEQSQTMIKLDSYSLQDMIRYFFPDKISSQDSIREKMENNLYLLKIGDKLKIFYLTLQLSQVAGCLWEVSLRQARAQRNEILLLQEFYNRGYIIPDHDYNKSKGTQSKYSGGKVLDPKIGFYETYTILVDFNSLYPSIIRHYDICFTTVRRNLIEVGYQDVEEEDFECMNNQSDALGCIEVKNNQKPILPGVLERLINQRKKAKSDLQVAKKFGNKELEVQLNIKQQALKLIANSIYGCLGFSFSRFYAKKLAMMITYFGRKLLESSIELVENSSYEVIYGDTDSIMIQTGMNNTREAVAEGLKIKKLINKQFHTKNKKQILEVELDGVFKKMLLLRKKKYAGLQVVNYTDVLKRKAVFKEIYKLEIKGLDMVRRDWSELTKQVSEQVLNILMYNENAVDDVQYYLKKVNYRLDQFQAKEEKTDFQEIQIDDGDDIPDIKIRHNLFLIRKQLKKKINEYADAQNIPHVKVAQDMVTLFKKTQNQLINHFIPYVITKNGKSQAEKAHHFGEYMSLLKTPNKLFLDFEFYKKNQLINPLERLIQPIDSGLNDRINEIFGYSKQNEDFTNDKAEIFQKKVEQARNKLGYYFKNVPEIDLDDFLLACQKCKGFCYSFQYKCQREVDQIQKQSRLISKDDYDYESNYENGIFKTLKNILKNNYAQVYKCTNCNYKLVMPFYSDKCPSCHEKKITEKDNEKIILGKLLFFKNLCKVFSKDNERDVTPTYFKEQRKSIKEFIQILPFENDDLFKPFQKYIKQYGESLNQKIFKL